MSSIVNISQASEQETNRTVIQSSIPPLMSLVTTQETGPQTTSSPESGSSINRKQYSSMAAQEIRDQFARNIQTESTLPALNVNVRLEAPINDTAGPSLRDYIDASVRIAQSNAIKAIEAKLKAIIPQGCQELIRTHHHTRTNTK